MWTGCALPSLILRPGRRSCVTCDLEEEIVGSRWGSCGAGRQVSCVRLTGRLCVAPPWNQPWCEIGCCSAETVETCDSGMALRGQGLRPVEPACERGSKEETSAPVGTRIIDRVPPDRQLVVT